MVVITCVQAWHTNLHFHLQCQGKDIKLVLEGETLKLVEAKTKEVLCVQPIAKMRVWGVGRTETRYVFYYI